MDKTDEKAKKDSLSEWLVQCTCVVDASVRIAQAMRIIWMLMIKMNNIKKHLMIHYHWNAHEKKEYEKFNPCNFCETNFKIMFFLMLMWEKTMKNWNHATFVKQTLQIMTNRLNDVLNVFYVIQTSWITVIWMLMWEKIMKNWNHATFAIQTLKNNVYLNAHVTFVTQTLQIMVSWLLMWEKSTRLIVTIVNFK